MHLTELELKKFKKVSHVKLSLETINVIVGGNNAGKSSILQGIHFFITAAVASRQQRQKTFSCDFLSYNPTTDFTILRNGAPYKNRRGDSDNESALTLKAKVNGNEGLEETSYKIALYKGKNHGNIRCERTGDYNRLGSSVTDASSLFSIYVPGLAGIPAMEELRVQTIVRRGVASGDANLYLRNIIYYTKKAEKLTKLNEWFSSVFDNAKVTVNFNEATDSHIAVTVSVDGNTVPLELAGTGVLQVLQIISYVTFFSPKILLLDEPDSHLHPNNQAVLAKILQRLSEETSTQIILCTHSRHIVDALHAQANFIWMKDGLIHDQGLEIEKLPILLDIGALDNFDKLKAGEIKSVLLTEDRDLRYLQILLPANDFNLQEHLIYSYRTSSNLEASLLFVDFLKDVANTCKVVIHRDRDFMTDQETEGISNKIRSAGAIPFITTGSDIESYFSTPGHVAHCIEEDVNEVADWIDNLAYNNHSRIQHDFTRKRDDIKRTLYRNKQNECPDTLTLIGNDIPLSPDKRKGKYMIARIREGLKSQYDKQSNLIESSEHLREQALIDILQELEAQQENPDDTEKRHGRLKH